MFIVAIDGPVGSGKSTIAKMIAKKAGFAYLDTGAMYRAIGWKAYAQNPPLCSRGGMGGAFSDEPLMNQGSQMETQIPPFVQGGAGGVFSGEPVMSETLTKGHENGIILRQAQDDNHGVMEPCHSELVELLSNHDGQLGTFSEESLDKICTTTRLDMELEDGHLRVMVDGKDISAELRTPEISRLASAVSVFASVRKYLVRMQREIGLSWAKKYGGVVVEGRDIGTVVFPDTPLKFYLDADINERGKRRWKELQEKGVNVSLDETVKEVISRDENDKNREIDPLRKADDAIVVDTTGLSIEEVVENILSIINLKSTPL